MNNIKQFKLKDNLECVRFLDNKKEKFELEFNLENGTSFNSFFSVEDDCLVIIYPPETNNFDSFLKITNNFIEEFSLKKINIIAIILFIYVLNFIVTLILIVINI